MLTLKQAQAAHENLKICKRCKRFSQTQRKGGCHGFCPCHWDNKDIGEHALSGYCPIGAYPNRGLGSIITKFIWWSFASRIARAVRIYNPKKCGCAERQAKLNRLGKSE